MKKTARRGLFVTGISFILAAGLTTPVRGAETWLLHAPKEEALYPTDQQLRELAVAEGFLPADPAQVDIQQLTRDGKTMIVWYAMDRKEKIWLINGLKKMYADDGVIIRLPAEYYVDELNAAIYNSIRRGDYDPRRQSGLGFMFRAFAVMDGDFDNGRRKIDTFNYFFLTNFGPQVIEQIKEKFPDKYERLMAE